MKPTGRRLTLSNDINTLNPPSGSISNLDYRLTTIFEDDRRNFAWKIVDIKQLCPVPSFGLGSRPTGWSLFSVRPESFGSAVIFGVWAANESPYDNSLIGIFNTEVATNYSLRVDHVATNHLSLLYDQSTIPYYNITLEEYEVSSTEEIMFKIKETSQNLDMIE